MDYKEEIEKEAELRQLFKNNSDCYADTHWYSDDTIPPTKVEGDVIQAMTEDTFIKIAHRIKVEFAIEQIKELKDTIEYLRIMNCNEIDYKLSELKQQLK